MIESIFHNSALFIEQLSYLLSVKVSERINTGNRPGHNTNATLQWWTLKGGGEWQPPQILMSNTPIRTNQYTSVRLLFLKLWCAIAGQQRGSATISSGVRTVLVCRQGRRSFFRFVLRHQNSLKNVRAAVFPSQHEYQ